MEKEREFTAWMGRLIQEKRKEKGISQFDLSLQTDISRATIQRIETGEINTTVIYLKKIIEILDIDASLIFNKYPHRLTNGS